MRTVLVVLVLLWSCSSTTDHALPAPSAAATAATARAAAPAPSAPAVHWPAVPSSARRVHVVRVVDGDTVVLDGIDVGYTQHSGFGHHARLIGIDTPEIHGRVGCFGRQASAFTGREIGGRDVLVDFDVERTDRYGRALVYIWKTDGTFFNGALALDGYALPLTIPPDVRYADLFVRWVREARESGRGLWSACP